jgi:hypothetical protein
MSASWEEEITELIPRTMLTQLQALSRRPAVVVTTRRLPPKPNAADDELHRDDFVDEESPSTLISLADLELVQRGAPEMSRADLELVRQAVLATEIALADLELESTDLALDDLEVVQTRVASSLAELELVQATIPRAPDRELRHAGRSAHAERELVGEAVRSTEVARVGLEQVQRAVRSAEMALADLELHTSCTELAVEDLELIEAVTTEVSAADLERIRAAIQSTEVSLARLALEATPSIADLELLRDGSIEVSLADLESIPSEHEAARQSRSGLALEPLEPVQLGNLESAQCAVDDRHLRRELAFEWTRRLADRGIS